MDNLLLKHNIAIDGQQPKKGSTEGSKYMGDQPGPHIEIGVETRGSERVFFVRDNGMGIDPRYSEKIFELFDKLDPGSDGSGLGLALVKRIIEVHGGRIWVESEGAGTGSTFCFTLAT